MRRMHSLTTTARGAALAAALTLALASTAAAQSGGVFDLTWHKVAGGGTSGSSGGSFSLAGTIAQPDAGVLAGGTFELTGGFWQGAGAIQGVDVPGATAPPARAVVSLRGFTTNPAPLSRLQVAFSLAGAEPARLELLDVAGRRVADESVGALGAGWHVVDLGAVRGAAPGLYWLRLAQSGVTRVVKVVLVE